MSVYSQINKINKTKPLQLPIDTVRTPSFYIIVYID